MKALVAVCVLVALVGVLAIDSAPTPSQPLPSRRARRPVGPSPVRSPRGAEAEAVVRTYARRSLNWSGETLRAQQARLAELSAGALREVHLVGAGDESTARALARQREGSRGRVLEVALRRRQRQQIHARVLVRERFQGRAVRAVGGWHTALYLALLQRRGARWRVVAWTPQAQTGPTRGEP